MAVTGDEKDWGKNDRVGVATKSAENLDAETKEPSDSDSSPDEVEFEKQESKILPSAVRTRTTSTEVTTVSDKTTEPETKKKLPLSKRLNPLKRNPPPVPTERQPSREYTANFFSKLTFQWISPLMSVSWSPILSTYSGRLLTTILGRLLKATRSQRSFRCQSKQKRSRLIRKVDEIFQQTTYAW